MSEYSVICGRQLIRSHCRAFSLLFPCSSSSLSLSFSPCMWLPYQLPCVSISFGVTLHTQALPNYNSTFGLLFVPIIYFSIVCYLIWVHILKLSSPENNNLGNFCKLLLWLARMSKCSPRASSFRSPSTARKECCTVHLVWLHVILWEISKGWALSYSSRLNLNFGLLSRIKTASSLMVENIKTTTEMTITNIHWNN